MKNKLIIFFFITSFLTNLYSETLRIKVTNSTAIYGETEVTVPHREYELVTEKIPYRCRKHNASSNDEFWGTMGSMVLGGLVGSQFGGGTGKDIATFAGAVTGANMAESARYGTCYRYEQVKKYVTRYSTETSYGKIAYKNCGYIGNRKICKKSKYRENYITIHY